MGKFVETPYVDKIILKELLKIKKRVLTKDRDYVALYDGEEGSGKSVLAMQHAKILDPNFTLDNVVYSADQFIEKIKDPKTKKGSCIVLDEAYSAASSRGALSEVNKAMVALGTEMRQKNLFVHIVLPTFFDLDKYFAIWRSRALFHVYFTPEDERRYVVFDKHTKLRLYLNGKKDYSYKKPRSPFPVCHFYDEYVVDEEEYRRKKGKAFQKRPVSIRSKQWLLQRNILIRYIYEKTGVTYEDINNIFSLGGGATLDKGGMSKILQEGGQN